MIPKRLKLEISSICNLSCIECQYNLMNRKRIFMGFTDIRDVIRKVQPTRLNLSGFGEQLLHPQFGEVIRWLGQQQGLQVRFFTNGMCLDDSTCAAIIAAGVKLVICSLDAGTADTYRKIRVGGEFDRVLGNLKSLLSLKKRVGADTLRVMTNFVICRENISDIKPYLRLCIEELDSVVPHFELFDSTGFDKENSLTPEGRAVDAILEAITLAVGMGLADTAETLSQLLPGAEQYNYLPVNEPCYYADRNLTVLSDGSVIPCQFYYNAQRVFGNIFHQELDAIWHSIEYASFRDAVRRSRKGVSFCENCRYLCCGACSAG